MTEGLSDLQLVVGFVDEGMVSHFDELVGRHMDRVRSMIYPMVLNHADTDDLTQEVFIRVARGLVRFKRRASFTTWLHRITMNTTHSFLRKRNRTMEHMAVDVPESADGAACPAGQLAFKEMDAKIRDALSSLSPVLREAITLTAVNGMAVKDAAGAAGCLSSTMYWRVHQARKILGGKLKDVMDK